MAARNETAISLPTLQPKVNFRTVPRRYEETKPVVVQDFTHRKIMDLGNEIHRRTLERCSVEKEMSIRQAEQAVWDQAEHIKREALEKTLLRAKLEHEKAVKKLMKAHEKSIKEKALQVEGEMQKLMLEQIQETREEGEREMREAVRRTEERCYQELLQAVSDARLEEQQAAAARAALVAKEEHEKFVNALEAAARRQEAALAALEEQKNQERQQAVAQAHKEEQDIATEKLANMRASYEAKLRGLEEKIQEKIGTILVLKNDILALDKEKARVQRELLQLREDFQHFIENTQPFEKGKASYMVPPVRSFDLP